MATVSELVERIAEAGGFDPKRVAQYARNLINAGLLPKSSGRDIRHVDARDAFALLIAIASTDKPAEGAKASSAIWLDDVSGLDIDCAEHDLFLEAGAKLLISLKRPSLDHFTHDYTFSINIRRGCALGANRASLRQGRRLLRTHSSERPKGHREARQGTAPDPYADRNRRARPSMVAALLAGLTDRELFRETLARHKAKASA